MNNVVVMCRLCVKFRIVTMAGVCIAVLVVGCALAAETVPTRIDATTEEEFINSAIQSGHQGQISDRVKEDLAAILSGGHELTGSPHLLSTIGVFCVSIGEVDCAVKALEQARLAGEAQFGVEHPFTINTLISLGAAYRKANRNDEALRVLNRALDAAQVVYGSSSVHEAEILANRSSAYLAAGDAKDALHDADVAIADVGTSDVHMRTKAAILANKAIALSKLGRTSESIDAINKADDAAKGAGASRPLLLAEVMTSRGIVETDAGEASAARQAFDEARQMYTAALGPTNERLAQLASLQARVPADIRGVKVAGGGARIGVSMDRFDDNFLATLRSGMVDYAKTLPGVSLQIEDASDDVSKQLSQVQNFIASGVDAIIINPVNTSATAGITKAAADAGVPLVYVNREPVDVEKLGPKAAFVASNEAESGTLETKEICKILGGKGNILVIEGQLSNQAAVQRTRDVHDVVASPDCDGIKIIAEQTADWDRTSGRNLMTNWLSRGMHFDAVVSNNDEMAIGAIQAMRAAGINTKTAVVGGVDATQDALASMKAGDLKVTVFQDAAGQGKGAVDAALALAAGKPVDKKVYIPFQLVTPANMNNFTKSR
jgi:ABC-type sugar transport system substrate-binding protein